MEVEPAERPDGGSADPAPSRHGTDTDRTPRPGGADAEPDDRPHGAAEHPAPRPNSANGDPAPSPHGTDTDHWPDGADADRDGDPPHGAAGVIREVLGAEPEDAYRPELGPAAAVLPGRLGDAVRAFDDAVDRGFDRLRGNAVADRVFYGASAVGDFSLIWHLASVVAALGGREREAVRLSAALGAESALINLGVKSLFRRTRPIRVEHATRRLRTPRSSSFPSGHATSGFMAATLLSAGRGPVSKAWWFSLAAVVASSRVHVRIHHGSDVAAGALIGVGLGRLVRKIWRV